VRSRWPSAAEQCEHLGERASIQHVGCNNPTSPCLVDPGRDEIQLPDAMRVSVHGNLDAGVLGELGMLFGEVEPIRAGVDFEKAAVGFGMSIASMCCIKRSSESQFVIRSDCEWSVKAMYS
jgi:hypothetical protein